MVFRKICDVGGTRTLCCELCRVWVLAIAIDRAKIAGDSVWPAFRVAALSGLGSALAVSVLHHVALGTRGVERLANFYREVLDLREVTRHLHADGTLRSIWLDLGGAVLMIESTSEAPRAVSGMGAGLFLLAFSIQPEQRADLEVRLLEAGCAVESRSEWTSYARDPDGNRIAVSAYPLQALGVESRP